MSEAKLNAGSYRDSAGHVYEHAQRVYRTIHEAGCDDYEAARKAGVLADAISSGFLIESNELEPGCWPKGLPSSRYVIEHSRIPYISYPYEWSFSQLKAAALHHLDFQLFLLKRDFKLRDASAYNIQFIGCRPIFIDLLSVAPYREGEFWLGHRQFCEQFLNPILLRAKLGVAHNSWYRGSLEGIPSSSLSAMLPSVKKLSWNMFSHVVLPAKLEKRAQLSPDAAILKVKSNGGLSRLGYMGFLTQLRNWISSLHPRDKEKTTWADYAKKNSYSDDERELKKTFISNFVKCVCPDMLMDLGCNTGDYSVTALDAGAKYVVGFDFDQYALDLAQARCLDVNEAIQGFLPLWLDASNPSPDHGWQQCERIGFAARAQQVDAVIALAFEHHLAIAKNIPLPQVVRWLVSLAPQGVIEFVPKEDVTIQKMLALREDVFPDYSLISFETALLSCAKIVARQEVSKGGRVLFWFCAV